MMIFSAELQVWRAPASRGPGAPGRGCPPSPPLATCRPPPPSGRRPGWTWWGRGPGPTSGTSRRWQGGSSGCPDQTMCSQIYLMLNRLNKFIDTHSAVSSCKSDIFRSYCRNINLSKSKETTVAIFASLGDNYVVIYFETLIETLNFIKYNNI